MLKTLLNISLILIHQWHLLIHITILNFLLHFYFSQLYCSESPREQHQIILKTNGSWFALQSLTLLFCIKCFTSWFVSKTISTPVCIWKDYTTMSFPVWSHTEEDCRNTLLFDSCICQSDGFHFPWWTLECCWPFLTFFCHAVESSHEQTPVESHS